MTIAHPNDISYVWARKSVALRSMKFVFHGRSAHAGLDPWNGRSALDAVELMNVGANYLREHVQPSCRIQYVITDGGEAPNIVPAVQRSGMRSARQKEHWSTSYTKGL